MSTSFLRISHEADGLHTKKLGKVLENKGRKGRLQKPGHKIARLFMIYGK